jgi:hypothetical protein
MTSGDAGKRHPGLNAINTKGGYSATLCCYKWKSLYAVNLRSTTPYFISVLEPVD